MVHPGITATQNIDVEVSQIQAYLGYRIRQSTELSETPSQNKKSNELEMWLNGKAHTQEARGARFKPQHHHKIIIQTVTLHVYIVLQCKVGVLANFSCPRNSCSISPHPPCHSFLRLSSLYKAYTVNYDSLLSTIH